jgi:Amt family ammonium transporter
LGRGAIVATLALVLVALTAGSAFAKPIYDPTTIPKNASDIGVSLNVLWVIIGAVLVIFMQAGFALVETGFCRAKHAAHVFSTNFAIFGLGMVGFFLVGYSFMFGGYSAAGIISFGYDKPVGDAFIGSGHWVFLWKGGFALSHLGGLAAAGPVVAFFLYMMAFMDTTATIPTGAMAERWKWKAFIGWGLFVGAIYYPLFGAWTWGGGWLSQLGNSFHLGFGYTDFAGSGVVHAMGGVAALAGALVLGPRIGKYGPGGSREPWRRTASRWPCWASSSSCSAGSGSTPPRRWRPPTSGSL